MAFRHRKSLVTAKHLMPVIEFSRTQTFRYIFTLHLAITRKQVLPTTKRCAVNYCCQAIIRGMSERAMDTDRQSRLDQMGTGNLANSIFCRGNTQ